MSTAADVRQALASLLEQRTDVVVDLSETEFIDSAVVHALADGRQLAEARGRELCFQLPAQAPVERVLGLCGLLDAWPIRGTRAEALAVVRRPRGRADVEMDRAPASAA